MDKRTERLLRDALAGLELEGRHYFDLEAAAIYRLEPAGHEAAVVLHPACPGNGGDGFATVMLGTPRHERTAVRCGGCGAPLELAPPPDVLAYGRSGILPAGGLARSLS